MATTPTNGDDDLSGTAGADTISGLLGNDVIRGGAGPDELRGDGGNDRLSGGLGDDQLFGGPGNDRAVGGEGDDRLSGEGGNDVLNGQAGNDVLVGGFGNDRLVGASGDDSLNGQGGNDGLFGGAGSDRLAGAAGNDTLSGQAGDDTLLGGSGRDRLVGASGNDILDGGTDVDTLFGGVGDDELSGGGGDDVLIGQFGRDTIDGGTGADRFVYNRITDGLDTIVDFDALEGDTLDFRNLLANAGSADADDLIQLRRAGDDTIVSISPSSDGNFTDIVRLEGEALRLEDLLDSGAILGLPGPPPPPGANQPPLVHQGIDEAIAPEGENFSFVIPNDAFRDPDGDDLTYSVTNPGQLKWVSFNASTETFLGTPDAHDGPVVVTVRATDPDGRFAETTFRINVDRKEPGTNPEGQGPTVPTNNDGDGSADLGPPALSGDGRFVAFVYGPGFLHYEPYVYDAATEVEALRLSTLPGLRALQDESINTFSIQISEDGRHVAFATDAQLAPNDNNIAHDVYRIDLADPSAPALLLSQDAGGGAIGSYRYTGDGTVTSEDVRIDRYVATSDDGQQFAFLNLNGSALEIYRAAADDAAAERIATFHLGDLLNAQIDLAGAGNGRIAIATMSGEFDNPQSQVLVMTSSGQLELTINGAFAPALSDAGDLIAFERGGRIFVRNLELGSASDVDCGTGSAPSMAGNGRWVAFETGDSVSVRTIRLANDGSIVVGDAREIPPLGNDDEAFLPSLSDDGRYLAFSSAPDTDAETLMETVAHRFIGSPSTASQLSNLIVEDPAVVV